MDFATRRVTYNLDYKSKHGEIVTLKTVYDIEFRRYPDSKYTHIVIRPDFGPEKRLKIHDCDITWKSLFRAVQWCSKHSERHISNWFEMDIEDLRHVVLDAGSGIDVIPEQKLSTGCGCDG